MAKRMNFYLTEVQVKRLQAMSKKTGLTASELIRRAIDEYWERMDKTKLKSEEEIKAIKKQIDDEIKALKSLNRQFAHLRKIKKAKAPNGEMTTIMDMIMDKQKKIQLLFEKGKPLVEEKARKEVVELWEDLIRRLEKKQGELSKSDTERR
jgi:predicted DNA-binding protein